MVSRRPAFAPRAAAFAVALALVVRAQAVPAEPAASGRGAAELPRKVPDGAEPAAVARKRAEAEAEAGPLRYVPLDVGIWPKVSVNALYEQPVRNAVSLSVAWAEPHVVDGVQLSLGAAAAQDSVRGLQVGGMVAAAGDAATGAQLGGLVAATGDRVRGAQGAGLIAGSGKDASFLQVGGLVAGAGGSMRGLQAASLVAGAGGDATGIQLGGLVAGAGGGGGGLQLGGLVAGTGGDFTGVQAGGFVAGSGGRVLGLQAGGFLAGASRVKGGQAGGVFAGAAELTGVQLAAAAAGAEDLRGVQLAIVNLSEHVRGAQLGIINIARRVDGAQLGLVNVAEEVRGASIAPVGYVDEAPRYAEAWASDLALLSAGARLGTRRITTLAQIGFDPRDGGRAVAGAGLGLRFWLADAVTLEPELWARGVVPNGDFDRFADLYAARLRVFYAFGDDLGAFAGAALSGSDDPDAADLSAGPRWRAGDDIEVWPGAFAGLSLRI